MPADPAGDSILAVGVASHRALEELRALGAAATPGPWGAGGGGVGTAYWDQRPERVVAITHSTSEWSLIGHPSSYLRELHQDNANARFVAAARNGWDALLDRVTQAEAALARVENLLAETDAGPHTRVHTAQVRAALAGSRPDRPSIRCQAGGETGPATDLREGGQATV